MPAAQQNALTFNPNALNLIEVSSYERLVQAPLNRAWENVLDWAHLPHLHSTSFDYVALQDAGHWGWRTWSNAEHTDHVELTVVDDERYVARSYQAGRQVTEIWTTLLGEGLHTKVHVLFYLPDIPKESVEATGQAMVTLYTRLWDEDEAMMRERHLRLTERRDNAAEVVVGRASDLRKQLSQQARVVFQLSKGEYELRQIDDKFIAHASICPHLLGPLEAADLSAGTVRCPWHGYQFSLDSGECILPEGADCRLPSKPDISVVEGNVIARAS